MAKSVTVRCSLPTGLTLRRFAMADGPLGIKEAKFVDQVTVGKGLTTGFDAAFYADWLAQNGDNAAVTGGQISAIEEAEQSDG